MPFDEISSQPVVDVKRRTTKVNIAVIVSVLVFLIAGAVVTWRVWHQPPRHTHDERVLGD